MKLVLVFLVLVLVVAADAWGYKSDKSGFKKPEYPGTKTLPDFFNKCKDLLDKVRQKMKEKGKFSCKGCKKEDCFYTRATEMRQQVDDKPKDECLKQVFDFFIGKLSTTPFPAVETSSEPGKFMQQ